MPVVAKKQAPKKALNKRAQRKKSLKEKVPDSDILPRAKVGGKLPPRLKHPVIIDSPVKAKSNAKPEEMWPERRCQSPVQILPMEAPVFVKGTELGLPELSTETKPELSPRVGDQSSHRLPKIYLGDTSPTPRWLIRRANPEAGQHTSPRSSVSSSSRLPELGQLRWEFDPGPPATHGQDESRLRDYAYQYLLNSLCDPIVRDEVREMIWSSFYAPTVAHVEDPLPIPPPPPHFKDQRPSDYVNLRPPISASNPDEYHFMYPGYERPSLTARAYQSNYTPAISHSSRGSNGSYSSTRWSISESTHTSSSVSTNPKDYVPEYHDMLNDDNAHHFGPSFSPKTKSSFSGEVSVLLRPPKRGKGRPKKERSTTTFYVDIQTLDEVYSAGAFAAGARGPRREAWRRSMSMPSPEAFSGDEGIRLPRLSRKAKKEAAARIMKIREGDYV